MDFGAARNTYGQRFIQSDKDRRGTCIRVWDFNPYLVSQRDKRKGASLRKGLKTALGLVPNLQEAYEVKPSVVKDEDIFQYGTFWSSLPYRRTTYRERFGDLHGVMMDEERILLLTVSVRALVMLNGM